MVSLHLAFFLHAVHTQLGLGTGTGKPVVIGSWVSWVWVQFWVSAYCYPYPWYHRYSQVHHDKVSFSFPVLNLVVFWFFFLISWSCHTVTWPNMAVSATHTSSSSFFLLLLPLPSHIKYQVSCSYYIITNQWFTFRSIIHLIPCFKGKQIKL